MRTFWKPVVAAALVLPAGAIVAGALVTSAAERPAPRETIILNGSPSQSPSQSPSGDATPDQTGRPTDPPSTRPGGGVPVVTHEPDDIDDRFDDEGRDDDHAEDDLEDGGGGRDSEGEIID